MFGFQQINNMSDFKLTIEKFSESDLELFSGQKIRLNDRGAYFHVCAWTFNNCQNLTMGAFNEFITYVQPEDYCKKLLEVKSLSHYFNKSIAVVDVNKSIFNKMKDYLPILDIFPYISTNRSEMVMVHIDFRTNALQNFRPTVKKKVSK